MRYIKVWCEYDFGGKFGGNNNEEVFSVSDRCSLEIVENNVVKMLQGITGLSDEDLEGLYDWEYIELEELGCE